MEIPICILFMWFCCNGFTHPTKLFPLTNQHWGSLIQFEQAAGILDWFPSLLGYNETLILNYQPGRGFSSADAAQAPQPFQHPAWENSLWCGKNPAGFVLPSLLSHPGSSCSFCLCSAWFALWFPSQQGMGEACSPGHAPQQGFSQRTAPLWLCFPHSCGSP